MPAKKARQEDAKGDENRTPTSRSKFGAIRWFNPAPNDADKKWLDGNDDKLVEMVFALFDGIQPDGRFTVKFDTKSGRWLAVLFIGSKEEGFEHDAMSVRGATAVDAVFLLAYFDLVKFGGVWEIPARGDQGRWG